MKKADYWKFMVVLGTDHAGLKHSFQRLENEIHGALYQIDDPRRVRDYLEQLRLRSQVWRQLEEDAPL